VAPAAINIQISKGAKAISIQIVPESVFPIY